MTLSKPQDHLPRDIVARSLIKISFVLNSTWLNALMTGFLLMVAIVSLRLFFTKLGLISFTDHKDESDKNTIMFVVFAVVIAPFVETLIIGCLHKVSSLFFKNSFHIFVGIVSVIFTLDHPNRGIMTLGVVLNFLVFSTQYYAIRRMQSARIAVLSVTVTHAAYNGSLLSVVLIANSSFQ